MWLTKIDKKNNNKLTARWPRTNNKQYMNALISGKVQIGIKIYTAFAKMGGNVLCNSFMLWQTL